MNNPRRKNKVSENTWTDYMLALLNEVGSDDNEDFDNKMNDWDTEFIANVDTVIDSSSNKDKNILTPNARIYVAPFNKNKTQRKHKKDGNWTFKRLAHWKKIMFAAWRNLIRYIRECISIGNSFKNGWNWFRDKFLYYQKWLKLYN